MAFDSNIDYQGLIDARKKLGFDDTDAQIIAWNQSRNEKMASDPLKYMQYASNPDAVWQTKAENAINPTYDMEKLALQNKYDTFKKTAADQLAYINPAYDKLVERTKDSYNDTKNMVNNETLNRGFGRSSYVVDKLADVANKENQAIGDINAERVSKVNEISSNIAMYDQQLADSLSQMDIDKAAKIAAKIDDLKAYYDNLKLQNDQFNLQKQNQEFNQNMQTKQFDLQKSGQEFDQNMQTKTFNYNRDMDLKKFTYQQTQDKIDNAYKAGQLSLQQRDAALAEAKFRADNDPNSIDNKLKRTQIESNNQSKLDSNLNNIIQRLDSMYLTKDLNGNVKLNPNFNSTQLRSAIIGLNLSDEQTDALLLRYGLSIN